MQSVQFLEVDSGLLRKNPWNTNKVSPADEAKIRRSIERNGLFKPIIVREVEGREGYEIVGGEHRWEQAVELGYTKIQIVNLGRIDDRRAKEIGVVDNARYGIDDTLSFAELLKELGDIDELQEFLPYGDTDLNAIFSASDIALDSLDIDENFDAEPEEAAAAEDKPTKAPKTHAVIRFKISLGDAERMTALIAATQQTHGFTTADDLTNAGDALVHLLADQLAPRRTAPAIDPDAFNAELDEALSNLEDQE